MDLVLSSPWLLTDWGTMFGSEGILGRLDRDWSIMILCLEPLLVKYRIPLEYSNAPSMLLLLNLESLNFKAALLPLLAGISINAFSVSNVFASGISILATTALIIFSKLISSPALEPSFTANSLRIWLKISCFKLKISSSLKPELFFLLLFVPPLELPVPISSNTSSKILWFLFFFTEDDLTIGILIL